MQANLVTTGTKKAMVQHHLMEREPTAGESEYSSAGDQWDTASRSSIVLPCHSMVRISPITGLGQTPLCRRAPAKQKHQGKAAKSSSHSSSSSSSSTDRSKRGRHRRHRRRRSSSLEEFLVSPFPTCSTTPAKYLVRKIRKGMNFHCLLGPGVEEGPNALQLQGKRMGERPSRARGFPILDGSLERIPGHWRPNHSPRQLRNW